MGSREETLMRYKDVCKYVGVRMYVFVCVWEGGGLEVRFGCRMWGPWETRVDAMWMWKLAKRALDE
jgi:hypothetical protein